VSVRVEVGLLISWFSRVRRNVSVIDQLIHRIDCLHVALG
jgi:hypothetical protein